jgi:hypothetical protein
MLKNKNFYFYVCCTFVLQMIFVNARADELAINPCTNKNQLLWNDCRGKQKNINGDEYEGNFKAGKKQGRGILKKNNGDVFIGNWHEDKPHGSGIEYFENNKKRRSGYWLSGQFVGANPVETSEVKKNKPENLKLVSLLAKPANCLLNIYVYPETVPLTQESSATWNGSCSDGKIVGKGELKYTWPDKSTCIFNGEFKNGEPKGFFKGDCIFASYKATFQGNALDFGQFFGEIDIEDKQKNKSLYTGESLYLTPNGRGLMRNITASNLMEGNFKNGLPSGFVLIEYEKSGDRYEGEMLNGKKHGKGIFVQNRGSKKIEGNWLNDNFVSFESVNLDVLRGYIFKGGKGQSKIETAGSFSSITNTATQTNQLTSGSLSPVISNNFFNISFTQPNVYGDFVIKIESKNATKSLVIDNEDFGPRADGGYLIRRIALVGKVNQFNVSAIDVLDNVVSQSILVSRELTDKKLSYARLDPSKITNRSQKDAVAIIIGISDYKSLPKADYSNDDARVFYDYAIRALSIKPENIKLLVDSDAEQANILKTFRTWLPSRVKPSTDVFIFYSGHGYPAIEGQGLYLLPQRADPDVIEDTGIAISKIINSLQVTKPKSVTIFMDTCYSGQSRSGEMLVANARPILMKSEATVFPEMFTVFSASRHDQISSSSPDLKHGIFSYYLMRGMEGEADFNHDNKITLGEMQQYLADNVLRKAASMNRKQEPQLLGDLNRVLIGH